MNASPTIVGIPPKIGASAEASTQTIEAVESGASFLDILEGDTTIKETVTNDAIAPIAIALPEARLPANVSLPQGQLQTAAPGLQSIDIETEILAPKSEQPDNSVASSDALLLQAGPPPAPTAPTAKGNPPADGQATPQPIERPSPATPQATKQTLTAVPQQTSVTPSPLPGNIGAIDSLTHSLPSLSANEGIAPTPATAQIIVPSTPQTSNRADASRPDTPPVTQSESEGIKAATPSASSAPSASTATVTLETEPPLRPTSPIALEVTGNQSTEINQTTVLGTTTGTTTTPSPQTSFTVAPPIQSSPLLAKPADIPVIVAESISTVEPGKDRVVVQLDPPELGRVTIDFKFEGQAIQAITVTGETPEALRQLRHMHFELIQALEQNGLSNKDLSFQQERSPQSQSGPSFSENQEGDDPSETATSQTDLQNASPPIDLSPNSNSGLNIKV